MAQEFTPEEQAANRLGLAYKDMQDAMRYLDVHDDLAGRQRAQGDNEFGDHCEAILIASIVAYCRPFKGSNSNGFADRRLIGDSLTAVQARPDLHKLVLTKRDTFIAHADWTVRNTEVMRLGPDTVMRRYPIPSVYAGLDLAEFRELIKAVGYECRRKCFAIDMPESDPKMAGWFQREND